MVVENTIALGAGSVIAFRLANEAAGIFRALLLPSATEAGNQLADYLRTRRGKNAESIILKSADKPAAQPGTYAHLCVLRDVLDYGSWVDDEQLQGWWAGLLASSRTSDGQDDGNLVFTNLLRQLNSVQARVLDHVCRSCEKTLYSGNVLSANCAFAVGLPRLVELTGIKSVDRLLVEITSLGSLGLTWHHGGGDPESGATLQYITPTVLALQLFIRCQGTRQSAAEFFANQLGRDEGQVCDNEIFE